MSWLVQDEIHTVQDDGAGTGAGAVPAIVQIRRRLTGEARPASVPCASCGVAVPVGARGPLPVWCGGTCRHRAWELSRAGAVLARTDAAVVVRETVELPVVVAPARFEWVGMLAELARQIAAGQLPQGCYQPVYEALTVTINQLTVTDRATPGNSHNFQIHPVKAWRQPVLAAQIDTGTPDTAHLKDDRAAAYAAALAHVQARHTGRRHTNLRDDPAG